MGKILHQDWKIFMESNNDNKNLGPIIELLIDPIGQSKIADTLRTLNDAITHICKEAAEILQNVGDGVISKLMTSLAQITAYLIDTTDFNDLTSQTLDAYLKWGQYGWTVIPWAPDYLYEEPPEDLKEANAVAGKYCTNAKIQILFDSIITHKRSEKAVEEAIACFANHHYKSCSLVLCSLIDAKLIKNQGSSHNQEDRSVGYGAANILNQKVKENEEIPLERQFCYLNLCCYLLTIFQFGDNFKQQPDVFNRNFVAHGMNSKQVRRRDCIQLFLAYYNLLDCLDYLHNV